MGHGDERRRPTKGSAVPVGQIAWLSLSDDDLLHQIEHLEPDHRHDADLLAVIRSERHFFIRQEAAKRLNDRDALKAHAEDRHVGQILARMMTREEDAIYLERLRDESRHLDVRNAAAAQLRLLLKHRTKRAEAGARTAD